MRCSKGLDMKWSLYMSSNQQNLTIGSIRLKSDYRVVKISLTTGLGSYPGARAGGWFLDIERAYSICHGRPDRGGGEGGGGQQLAARHEHSS